MKVPSKYIFKIALVFLLVANANAQSLWLKRTTNERGMFADRVASNVGDILTVLVDETTKDERKLKTETKKSASFVGAVTSYLFPNSSFGTHKGDFPETNVSLDNDNYSGEGNITNQSTLQLSGSVTVIDVLPNGNLVIEGRRSILFSNEREFAIFTGFVRPYDIKSDNTIKSTQIADVQIHLIREGSASAAQKKGWLERFKDFVNPF